jgi:small subunit ribosomal protein S6
MLKSYETVFIATPVLSDSQMKEAVAKYTSLIKENGGEIVYEEDWGLKQLAYPIQHKTSGFYYLIEFKAEPSFVATLETQYHRDERIIRFITVTLDQHAVAYAEHRRQNRAAKKAAAVPVKEEAPVTGQDEASVEVEELNED